MGILQHSPQWAVSIALILEVLLIFLAVSGFAQWFSTSPHQSVLPAIARLVPLLILLAAIPIIFGRLYIGLELFIGLVVGFYAYLFRDRPTSVWITGMPAVLIVGLIFALIGLVTLGAGALTGSTIVIVIGILFALIGMPLAYEAWNKRSHP